MKKFLNLFLLASIFYSCKNVAPVNQQISPSKEIEIKTDQIKVLTLGTFHFNFPNLDVAKTDKKDQIDILESQYQKEIELIVDKLAKFKPTKIIIERQPQKQKLYDSLYASFLKGEHKLTRSEEQQIGFRLAKKLGLKQLYCTDAWGTDYEDVKKVVKGNDTIAKGEFLNFFYNHPDSTLNSFHDEKQIFKTEGILAELKRMNSEEFVKKGLGDYLIGIFKYEIKDNTQFGPDFVTSWWFNRNLRIFRNIQRINASPEDRILVIYGAGHMNLLNIFFEASPEFELLKVNEYLD